LQTTNEKELQRERILEMTPLSTSMLALIREHSRFLTGTEDDDAFHEGLREIVKRYDYEVIFGPEPENDPAA
jgi:hypothetical protein